MNINITKTIKKNYPTGDQVIVRAEEGRFTCKNPDLFDALLEAEGKTVDIEVDGTLIVAINDDEDEALPFPETNGDEKAPSQKSTEKTPSQKSTEKEPRVKNEKQNDTGVRSPKAAPKPAENKPKPEETPKAEPKEPKTESKAEPKTEPKAASDTANETPDDAVIEQNTEGLSDDDKFEPNTQFPLLRAEEIEVRVGQVYDNYITLLLYKNARCDQDRFDAKYGPLGWQSAYQILDGQLFCTVSVRNPNTGEWVGKTDVGTPSNTEAEKGRVSDAFKRACVCWGSGRELYSAPEIRIYAEKTQIKQNAKGKLACYDKFTVKTIAYDEQRRISKLEIYGAHARGVVFRFGK
jgi:hypothetical protein